MKLFLALTKQSGALISLSLLLSLVSAVCNIYLIYCISNAISGDLEINNTNAALYFGLVAITTLFGIITQRVLRKIGEEVTLTLRLQLSQQILSANYSRLEQLGKARLLTSLVDDVNTIHQAFNMLPLAAFNSLIIVFGLAYLAWLSWEYLILMMLLLAVAVFVIVHLSTRINESYAELREERENLHGNINTLLTGNRELSISVGKKRFFYHQLMFKTVECLRRISLKVGYQEATLNNTMTLTVFTIFGIFIFIASFFYPLSAQVLSGFLITLMFIRNPIGIVIDTLPAFISARHAFSKIDKLEIDEEPTTQLLQGASSLPPVNKVDSLSFENLSFQYPDANGERGFKIGPLNMQAQSGEVIFITGGNGVGKSTLGKVLTSLYTRQEGNIVLNGKPLEEKDMAWYRHHIGVIFSDFFLFDFIVGPDGNAIDGEDVEDWLTKLKLNDKVTISEGVISTTKLSHGQRKRLALMSACLEEKPILLFDEWAADQDPNFRGYFYKELLLELKAQGKIVFVISHDESYFHLADKLYTIDNGQLVHDASRGEREKVKSKL